MTKQEIEKYIAIHGNGQKVVDTIKEMIVEGFSVEAITEEQLTDRLRQKHIGELNDPAFSSKQSYSLTQQSREMPSKTKYLFAVIIGFIIGPLWGIIAIGPYVLMKRYIDEGDVDKAWENAKEVSKRVSLGAAITCVLYWLLSGNWGSFPH